MRPTAFKCSGLCGRELPKALFSGEQFAAGARSRMCKACTAARPDLFECNGGCGRRLPKVSFSANQFSRGGRSRRCADCVAAAGATQPRAKAPPPDCWERPPDPGWGGQNDASGEFRPLAERPDGERGTSMQEVRRAVANCQNLPSEDAGVLNLAQRLIGKAPTGAGRAVDYAAVERDVAGLDAGGRLNRQGQIFARDTQGRLNVFRKGEWSVVVTDPARRLEILKSAHYTAMHGGWRAMDAELLARKVYWQYMHYDCMFVCKKCDDCQLHTGASMEDEVPPLATGPRALECNDLVAIDLKGMPGGKQMCLVVDYMSHRVEGAVLQGKTGRGVAEYLYKLFLRNDPPVCILSDNGTEFKNHVAAACKSEWQIGRRFTPVARPRADGAVERMNGVAADFLAKLGSDESTWEAYLDEALAVYNRKLRPAIGCAPNTLWFGRRSRMAVLDMELEDSAGHTAKELMEKVAQWELNPAWGEAAQRLRDRKEKLLANAAHKQAAADLDTKERFSRRNASRLNAFLPGEYVKMKVSQYSAKMHGRIGPRTTGPNEVLQNWGAHLLLEGLERSVPASLCSRYYHDVCNRGEGGEETEVETEEEAGGGPEAGGETAGGERGGRRRRRTGGQPAQKRGAAKASPRRPRGLRRHGNAR